MTAIAVFPSMCVLSFIMTIGHVSLALRNEVGGRKSIFSMLKDSTYFVFGCNNRVVPKLCCFIFQRIITSTVTLSR